MPDILSSVVLDSPDDLTTGDLDSILVREGLIAPGSVESIELLPGSSHGNESIRRRIAISYRQGTPADAPTQLLLKVTRLSEGEDEGTEQRFVLSASKIVGSPPIVRCFDAAYDGVRSHLLLEDLTQTHRLLSVGPRNAPEDGAEDLFRRIARAYAKLHSVTWGSWSLRWADGRCEVASYQLAADHGLPNEIVDLVGACE